MFAVGDEKQSIYSFQGARPERFSDESIEDGRRVRNGGEGLQPYPVAALLPLDRRCSLGGRYRIRKSRACAVASVPAMTRVVHASNRIGHPGLVEVWDAIAPADSIQEDDWTAAFDATPEDAPANILAQRIASVLAGWIGRETVIEKGVKRPMQPGDVIVLVRKRDAFVNALTRALKTRQNIPVAGADRLVLTNHIAVQDLMALGRFVLLPQDDLSLAAVLKSPLFNLNEDDIAALAVGEQPSVSVWKNLVDLAADEDEPLPPCPAEASSATDHCHAPCPSMISTPRSLGRTAGGQSISGGSAPRSATSSTNS